MNWLHFLGACGITIILVMSTIMEPLRMALPPPIGLRGLDPEDPGRPILLACTLCTGVWVGLAVGILAWLQGNVSSFLDVALFGFAVSFGSYVGGTWLRERVQNMKGTNHEAP